MSFFKRLTQKLNPHKKNILNKRKEKADSQVAYKRTSAFTSKGSITLEAAIAVPVFFFAVLSLAYLLEMMALQTNVRNALCSAGREAAKAAYINQAVLSWEMEKRLQKTLGSQLLNQSILVGGQNGLDCSKSSYNCSTGVLDLRVQYQVEVPILMFRIPTIHCEEKLRMKGWTGYATTPGAGEEGATVYVTETGIVYHADADCTYLDMSIRTVRANAIDEERNQSGGKYYPCESCGNTGQDADMYYVTDYGTRYHKSLDCKKIKRNIYAISLSEAYGLGGCSKCVK